MSSRRFGDYLAQILRERACSGSQLAHLLGIDPALVYRWLRNEAVPKLDTAYCDEIVYQLHLSQAELSQLKDAQVFSPSRPMERRPKTRSNSAAVERLLRQAAPRPRSNGDVSAASASPRPPAPRPSGVIWGRPAMLETVINLLEDLPTLPRLQSNTVMFTFQGAEDAFDGFPELHDQYVAAACSARRRGALKQKASGRRSTSLCS